MATILEFRPTEAAAARISKVVEGSLGQIIIFPGIRIERRESGDTPRRTATASRRRPGGGRKSRV